MHAWRSSRNMGRCTGTGQQAFDQHRHLKKRIKFYPDRGEYLMFKTCVNKAEACSVSCILLSRLPRIYQGRR